MNYADYICVVNLKERNKMETINIQFQVPSTGQYTLDEFVAKLKDYADSDVVKSEVKTTRLHKIIVIYRSVDMVVCEEIE